MEAFDWKLIFFGASIYHYHYMQLPTDFLLI